VSGGRNGASRGRSFPGAKPLSLMQQILHDYTLPGDLVCDPFSGSGTTARACMIEGRRFVGAEKDPATHRLAMERIRGLGPSTETQPSLFGGGRG
jgi:site-specific DNA-methyltransferase (adenine-specific)